MNGLREVRRFHVPASVVAATMDFLAAIGEVGHEALVLWAGQVTNSEASVVEAVVPPQTPIRTHSGLAVYVGPEALHRLGVWLHDHKLRLLAQVHSHGEAAYHSDTDDRHSIMTTLGGVSLVVPLFAQGQFRLDTCSVHRLGSNGWMKLNTAQANALINVEE